MTIKMIVLKIEKFLEKFPENIRSGGLELPYPGGSQATMVNFVLLRYSICGLKSVHIDPLKNNIYNY